MSPGRSDWEDRRLFVRIRVSMFASVAISAAIFVASAVALSLLVAAYDRHGTVTLELERARVLGERVGIEAVRLQRAGSPEHRVIILGRLQGLYARFHGKAETALGDLRAVSHPALIAALDDGPRPVRALLDEIAAQMAVLGAAPATAATRAASRRLRLLTQRELSDRMGALIDIERGRAEQLAGNIRGAGLALGLGALLLLLAQWLWSCRPVLREVEARTEALLEANSRVERSLLFDGLTNLPNRRNLQESLARIAPGAPLGLLHIDLAGFHAINTTLGREAGDQLLRYAAESLGEIAMTADILARTGTDEFVLVTGRRTDPEQLQELAVEIIEQLAQPVEIDGHQVSLEAVIGIAARSAPGEDPEKLLANADIARARAREEGGSVYFSVGMRERLAARRQTAQELLQALVRDEIEPFFQPQIEAASGRITGVEALARWRHPERGVLNPHFFLDIAEQAHLGHRITLVMIRKSLEALAAWRAQGLEVPRVSINFGARELRSPELADILAFDLERVGLAPRDLAIEVLESALIEDETDPILANVAALSRAGHHIDLDDFGTGHAALSYLRHLSVDRLKIDRSFIRDLHLRPELRKMTQAMIHLAKALDISAMAEGIESQNEWRLLIEMGCDDLQGFVIGKPMPAAALPGWIAEHEGRRSAGRLIAAA
ncbi:putative bifunctional diguanylate cyclase/phosphodiesterase [Paralimibaculum aggregatum]|nr:bifunctional diguanylate cyclase/phosphodiesterase [Limibaculum sp. NKW23]